MELISAAKNFKTVSSRLKTAIKLKASGRISLPPSKLQWIYQDIETSYTDFLCVYDEYTMDISEGEDQESVEALYKNTESLYIEAKQVYEEYKITTLQSKVDQGQEQRTLNSREDTKVSELSVQVSGAPQCPGTSSPPTQSKLVPSSNSLPNGAPQLSGTSFPSTGSSLPPLGTLSPGAPLYMGTIFLSTGYSLPPGVSINSYLGTSFPSTAYSISQSSMVGTNNLTALLQLSVPGFISLMSSASLLSLFYSLSMQPTSSILYQCAATSSLSTGTYLPPHSSLHPGIPQTLGTSFSPLGTSQFSGTSFSPLGISQFSRTSFQSTVTYPSLLSGLCLQTLQTLGTCFPPPEYQSLITKYIGPSSNLSLSDQNLGTNTAPGVNSKTPQVNSTTSGVISITRGDSSTTPGDISTTPGDSSITPEDSCTYPKDSLITCVDNPTSPGDGSTYPYGSSAIRGDRSRPPWNSPTSSVDSDVCGVMGLAFMVFIDEFPISVVCKHAYYPAHHRSVSMTSLCDDGVLCSDRYSHLGTCAVCTREQSIMLRHGFSPGVQ